MGCVAPWRAATAARAPLGEAPVGAAAAIARVLRVTAEAGNTTVGFAAADRRRIEQVLPAV